MRMIIDIEKEILAVNADAKEQMVKRMETIVSDLFEYMGHLMRKSNLSDFQDDMCDFDHFFPAFP